MGSAMCKHDTEAGTKMPSIEAGHGPLSPFAGIAGVPALDRRTAGDEHCCRSERQHRLTQFSLKRMPQISRDRRLLLPPT